jgi:hypothetical protein
MGLTDDNLDFLLDRLPEIKKELEPHGYSVIKSKTLETSRGVLSCVFWIGIIVALPLIGAGVIENKLLGAGVGVAIAVIAMLLVQLYEDKKNGTND